MNPEEIPTAKKQIIFFKKLVVPLGMRSIYWKYFGFPGNEEGEILTREKIVCTICKFQMAYNGNTSNLRMHLQSKHTQQLIHLEATSPPYTPKTKKSAKVLKRQHETGSVVHTVSLDGEVILGQNTPTPRSAIKFISIGSGGGGGSDGEGESAGVEYVTSDSLENAVTYYFPEETGAGSSRGDPHEMGDALIRFFASELLAPSIIDSPSFHRFVSKLNNSISLPTSKQLEEEVIPQQYEDLKNGVISEIESLTEYSLSVEEWNEFSNQSFFTFSVHFINDEQLITRTLSTLQLNKDNLDAINKTLAAWGIDTQRLTMIITATADKQVTDTLQQWAPIVPCFLFVLQKSINACFQLPEVKYIIQVCRTILSTVKLRQNYAPIPETVNLDICMDFRNLWTSTYEMLQEFVNKKTLIQKLELSPDVVQLCDEDWENLISIVDTFSPFKVTVQTLQEENPALLSIVKPLLWQLVTNYLQLKDTDTEFTRNLKEVLKSELTNAYSSQNQVLQIATTLDPRFKQLSYATEEEANDIHKKVKELLSKIVAECGNQSQMIIITNSSSSTPEKKLSGMQLLLGELCSPIRTEFRPNDRAALEIKQYTSETPVAFDENPLTWWHNAEVKCPNLAKLSKRYTCVPACAIPTPRIPFKEREKFERQRVTLPMEIVDKVIFLNGNLI